MIAVPKHVAELQKRWREKGSLSASEIEILLNWQMQATDTAQAVAKDAGEQPTLQRDDLVEFMMPQTVGGSIYILEREYYGKCQATYGVFCELARMREQDIIGFQELTQRRGEPALGTGLKDFIEFTVPELKCRLVKRAAAIKAEEAKRAAAA